MDGRIHRSQKNYRRLLQALSRPGRVVRLETVDGPAPFAAARALAECLLDSEVGFCVAGSGGAAALQAAIAGATGARVSSLEDADFIFFIDGGGRGGVCRARRGAFESPEDGATLVYCVDPPPAGGPERFRVRLTGPGIPGPAGIAPEMAGIPIAEFQALVTVNADYPLGVDAFFVRPDGELMGLPRSTRIQVR
ncbi:MAG: phosphonate C-P lyase system protein PhnH [Desulfobacterales bacterium]|jgi:alpha-D-ribose 1-methylphosphonate 5-triphosphate synthase subunit PhnH|nr:phosphonate C-P lyase system protein PhnH [Desulfobacterales bacterium]